MMSLRFANRVSPPAIAIASVDGDVVVGGEHAAPWETSPSSVNR